MVKTQQIKDVIFERYYKDLTSIEQECIPVFAVNKEEDSTSRQSCIIIKTNVEF